MRYNTATKTLTVNGEKGLTRTQAVARLLDRNPGWTVQHANHLIAEVVRAAQIARWS